VFSAIVDAARITQNITVKTNIKKGTLREIHKKQKNSKKLIFLAPTPTNRVYDRNFPYA
jgi:hypothetical protein